MFEQVDACGRDREIEIELWFVKLGDDALVVECGKKCHICGKCNLADCV